MSARNGSSTVASRVLVKVISEPSGDHDGPMSSLGWVVRLVSPLPSLFTAQISHGSPPLLSLFWNTTIVLSGDQSGPWSSPSKLSPLKIASFWPFGSIVTISHPWFLTPANAILVPSGDQSGSRSFASVWVSGVAGFCPFASITKMSDCSEMISPGISLTKVIWAPDGAHDGWYSRSSGVSVRLVWLVPSASITQRSAQGCPSHLSLGSVPCFTKTILPSGEVVWAEGSVESRALTKNNSAIETPSKMIARLAPTLRTTTSCMTSPLRQTRCCFACALAARGLSPYAYCTRALCNYIRDSNTVGLDLW